MKNFIFLCLFPLLGLAQTQIGVDIDGEAAEDFSGRCVSVSADGSTVAIGAPFNDGSDLNSGQVRVYKYAAGNWTQFGADINGEYSNDQSGSGVSISDDGNIVAIGAPYNSGGGAYAGHVRVYKNISGTWTKIGADIDGELPNDNSGKNISISADGSIVAIGAIGNDGPGYDSGHVRVYQNISGTWTKIGNDINGEAAYDTSGGSVSLSADGSIVAIGAPLNSANGNSSGQVRVYKNISGVWTQIGIDIDGVAQGNNFGSSVSLSADGSIVAIGGYANLTDSGQVQIYQNIAGTWTQIGADINGEAPGDYSGSKSISLSADGSIVAIGAYGNDGNGNESGHVRMYQNISGTWTQIGIDIDGEAANDRSGWSVSLSNDGKTVAIGAYFNAGNGTNAGHVRVYDLSALLASNSFVLSRFSVYPNPTSDAIKISLQDNLTLEKVNIYNDLGQLVKTEKQNEISVSDLSKGSYFVEVITSGGKATKTIVVE